MLTAAISTVALALALGPQLQLGLQVVLEEAQPVVEAPAETDNDPIVESGGVEDVAEVLPRVEPAEELPVDPVELPEAAPEETPEQTGTDLAPVVETSKIEETLVEEAEAAAEETPALDLTPPETVQSGEVPAAEWNSILREASAALAAAKTAKGNFIQTNTDGSVTTGTFALNRPGRMRFDYDDPTPILIVSDGTTVAMEDSELETVDRVPIGSTPLGLILSTDLNVGQDVEVLSVMQNADGYGIRVADANGELEGTLTMVFNKASFELLGWLTTDGNFRTTVVDLVDVETNVRVDPRLFRLDEAEDEEDER